jgi:hypothetical protein
MLGSVRHRSSRNVTLKPDTLPCNEITLSVGWALEAVPVAQYTEVNKRKPAKRTNKIIGLQLLFNLNICYVNMTDLYN